jgi:hypothetical protein
MILNLGTWDAYVMYNSPNFKISSFSSFNACYSMHTLVRDTLLVWE